MLPRRDHDDEGAVEAMERKHRRDDHVYVVMPCRRQLDEILRCAQNDGVVDWPRRCGTEQRGRP